MDVYIVLDGPRVVGVSAKLQGAELIRADEGRRMQAHNALRIENHELQDFDE